MRWIAAACVVVVVKANTPKRLTKDQMTRVHSLLDKDSDGSVTIPEMMTHAQDSWLTDAKDNVDEIFHSFDKNGDGYIIYDEYLADVMGNVGHLIEEEQNNIRQVEGEKFQAADANNDGFLDKSDAVHLLFPETHAGVLKIEVANELRLRDMDGDKQLSYAEVHRIPDSDVEHDKTEGHETRNSNFEELDENKDGVLSLTEFIHMASGRFHVLKAAEELFASADTSGDGRLSVEELRDNPVPADAMGLLYDWASRAQPKRKRNEL